MSCVEKQGSTLRVRRENKEHEKDTTRGQATTANKKTRAKANKGRHKTQQPNEAAQRGEDTRTKGKAKTRTRGKGGNTKQKQNERREKTGSKGMQGGGGGVVDSSVEIRSCTYITASKCAM